MSDRPFDFQNIFDIFGSADERVVVLKDVLSSSDVPISKALKLADLMGCALTVQLKPKDKKTAEPATPTNTVGGAA